MQSFLLEKQSEIADICHTHQVQRLFAFGSVVRDDFKPGQSDIDLLVDFREPLQENYIDNKLDLQAKLVELLDRRVDLLVDKYVRNPYLQRILQEERQLLYAA